MKAALGSIVSVLLVLGIPVFSADAPAPAGSELKVDLATGTGIDDRDLVGGADAFSVDVGRVVAWARTTGATEPTEIAYVWFHKGAEQAMVAMPIRSSSYRSWSTKTITGMLGAWTVEVRDAGGRILASCAFEVTAAP